MVPILGNVTPRRLKPLASIAIFCRVNYANRLQTTHKEKTKSKKPQSGRITLPAWLHVAAHEPKDFHALILLAQCCKFITKI